MTAYFVCQLMNVSGKSLKRRLAPKELLKPLHQPVKQRDRKADEDYLKQKFNLPG